MNTRLIAAALVACTAMTPTIASAQLSIGISVRLAPPPLPVYVQPPLPGPDYLWTPGYWAWDDFAAAYYWVPGTWVRAPRAGLLWTPPWWGWNDGVYLFHTGYWGPHIGFYGGVAYGFGYTGFGYQGGYWNGGHLFYNQTVNNITNVHVTNVYQTTITNNHITRVSYNGGPGGVRAQPRAEDQQAAREQHIVPTANQQQHVQMARADPQAFASANHGHPPVLATPRALSAQGNGAAANRPAYASQGQPGRPRPQGMAPGGGGAPFGGAGAPENRGQQPERFAGGPGTPREDARFDAPRSAPPARPVNVARGSGAGDMAFDRPPPAPGHHANGGGDPFAPARHAAPPHMSQPPHAPKPPPGPKPPHQHPQGHHDDHHHG